MATLDAYHAGCNYPIVQLNGIDIMAGAPLGNQNAVKGKMFEQALKMTLAKRPAALLNIADNLVTQAEAGEQWAVQMVADRLDGKAKQQIVGGDDDDNPVRFIAKIERVIVDPKGE